MVVALAAMTSCLSNRNLNPTIYAFCREHEVDRASEFVRYKIAYEIGAVAGWMLGAHQWTAKLVPNQGQVCPVPSGPRPQFTETWPDGIDRAPYFAAFVASSCSTLATA